MLPTLLKQYKRSFTREKKNYIYALTADSKIEQNTPHRHLTKYAPHTFDKSTKVTKCGKELSILLIF